jgi:hypothetical protein
MQTLILMLVNVYYYVSYLIHGEQLLHLLILEEKNLTVSIYKGSFPFSFPLLWTKQQELIINLYAVEPVMFQAAKISYHCCTYYIMTSILLIQSNFLNGFRYIGYTYTSIYHEHDEL